MRSELNTWFSLVMVIIRYAGSCRAVDLLPSHRVVELSDHMCGWRGRFGIAHCGCSAGAGLENQTCAGLWSVFFIQNGKPEDPGLWL